MCHYYQVYLKETLEAWPFLCIHAITAFAHPCAADALFPPTPYMDVSVSREAGCRERPGMYLRRFPVDIPDNSDLFSSFSTTLNSYYYAIYGYSLTVTTMPIVKRNSHIPEEVPDALKQKNRDKLVQAIDDIDTWGPTDEPVVETIRKIREAQTDPVRNGLLSNINL